ncbi:hypothetical protein ACOJBM_01265 [Rhizobium beringeri]
MHGIAWCGRCGYKMYVRYKGGGEMRLQPPAFPLWPAGLPACPCGSDRCSCGGRFPGRVGAWGA